MLLALGSSAAGRVNLDWLLRAATEGDERPEPEPQRPKTAAIPAHLACQHKTKPFSSPRGPSRNPVDAGFLRMGL